MKAKEFSKCENGGIA